MSPTSTHHRAKLSQRGTLALKGEQKLVLQTKILTGLKLMALPLPALREKVAEELAENPVLEELEPPPTEIPLSIENELEAAATAAADASADSDNNDISSAAGNRNQDNFLPPDEPPHPQGARHGKPLASIIEETASTKTTLSDELLLQLALVYERGSPQFKLGEILCSLIDTDGFLSPAAILSVQADAGNDAVRVAQVAATLKQFMPPGIAAANLQEALFIQLQQLLAEVTASSAPRAPANTALAAELQLAMRIVTKAFKHIRTHRLEPLAKHLGVSQTKIAAALKQITQLEPRPARNYSLSQEPVNAYSEADAAIFYNNGHLELSMNDYPHKRLRINPVYQEYYSKQRTAQPTKHATAISDNLFRTNLQRYQQRAEEFLENLNYRASNLEKILRQLMNVQEAFFREGFASLRPYSLSELARELKMDIGTASRLVTQKYLATSWGLLSLRKLFSATKIQVQNNLNKENPTAKTAPVSVHKIQVLLKELIAAYPDKKLSDQQLMEMLSLRGYKLARRTVTKYRQRMNIPPSFARKASQVGE